MAFFTRKKNKPAESEEKQANKPVEAEVKTKEKGNTRAEAKKPSASNSRLRTIREQSLSTDRNLSSVIIEPRITEKAVNMSDSNVYTFNIRKDATKFDVRDAVKELFKVTPTRINIVNKAPRQFMSRSRGRKVTERGAKKAYVYLKEGDRIDLA